jgi:hypothetical protein
MTLKSNDFERLNIVFQQLNDEKIISIHCAGYTMSDGMSDVGDIKYRMQLKDIQAIGWCFYHEQDYKRAINSEIKLLNLAFGSVSNQESDTLTIAQRIVNLLKNQDFTVSWDGTTRQRITVIELIDFKLPENFSGQKWAMKQLNISK